MKHFRLVAVGDDIAVILPQDVRELLDARVGGTVAAEDTPHDVALMADGRYARAMRSAEMIMDGTGKRSPT